MDEIIRLSAADFDEAIDFMNMVFSMDGNGLDFPRLLPKLYQPDDRLMRCNYALRRQGRIRAVVGSFPMTLQIGGRQLKVAGIGGVSTHPRERSGGLMRQLMERALTDMREDGVSLSVLGGQRQRYGYYGYEVAGSEIRFSVSPHNLKHALAGQTLPAITLKRLAASPMSRPMEGSDDDSWRQAAWQTISQWHAAQPVHVLRGQPIRDILLSWGCDVFLAENERQEPIACFAATEKGQVNELLVASPDDILPVAAAWIREYGKMVEFVCLPWQTGFIVQLAQIAEGWRQVPTCNLQILDWPQVIEAFLQYQADTRELKEGSLCVELSDLDIQLSWRLKNGTARCEQRPAGSEKAHLVMTHAMLTRLAFGPLPPHSVLPGIDELPADIQQLLRDWLPLPMGWPIQDNV